ncbi:MAG: hypothetical protein VX278_20120, partial [Myxococcota bacterium]|nr:hypothetical protein [Myxococcota bacterium]
MEQRLERFFRRYLTPIELFALFSRCYAGERFLLEPSMETQDDLYRNASKEVLLGKGNRFFWEQVSLHVKHHLERLNTLLKDLDEPCFPT